MFRTEFNDIIPSADRYKINYGGKVQAKSSTSPAVIINEAFAVLGALLLEQSKPLKKKR